MKNLKAILCMCIIGATSCNTPVESKPKSMTRADSIVSDISSIVNTDSIILVNGEKSSIIDNPKIVNFILTGDNSIEVNDTDKYIVIYARMEGSLAKYRKK